MAVNCDFFFFLPAVVIRVGTDWLPQMSFYIMCTLVSDLIFLNDNAKNILFTGNSNVVFFFCCSAVSFLHHIKPSLSAIHTYTAIHICSYLCRVFVIFTI